MSEILAGNLNSFSFSVIALEIQKDVKIIKDFTKIFKEKQSEKKPTMTIVN